MPGNKSRQKGYRAENQVVKIARAAGCSVTRSAGSRGTDLMIDGRSVSVKRREKGLEWIYRELGLNEYLLYRIDRGYWLKIEKWYPERGRYIDDNRPPKDDRPPGPVAAGRREY